MKNLFKNQRYKVTELKAFTHLIPYILCLLPLFSFSQETQKDSVKSIEEVLITAVRAKEKNPIPFTNVSKESIAPRNLGQDIPIL